MPSLTALFQAAAFDTDRPRSAYAPAPPALIAQTTVSTTGSLTGTSVRTSTSAHTSSKTKNNNAASSSFSSSSGAANSYVAMSDDSDSNSTSHASVAPSISNASAHTDSHAHATESLTVNAGAGESQNNTTTTSVGVALTASRRAIASACGVTLTDPAASKGPRDAKGTASKGGKKSKGKGKKGKKGKKGDFFSLFDSDSDSDSDYYKDDDDDDDDDDSDDDGEGKSKGDASDVSGGCVIEEDLVPAKMPLPRSANEPPLTASVAPFIYTTATSLTSDDDSNNNKGMFVYAPNIPAASADPSTYTSVSSAPASKYPAPDGPAESAFGNPFTSPPFSAYTNVPLAAHLLTSSNSASSKYPLSGSSASVSDGTKALALTLGLDPSLSTSPLSTSSGKNASGVLALARTQGQQLIEDVALYLTLLSAHLLTPQQASRVLALRLFNPLAWAAGAWRGADAKVKWMLCDPLDLSGDAGTRDGDDDDDAGFESYLEDVRARVVLRALTVGDGATHTAMPLTRYLRYLHLEQQQGEQQKRDNKFPSPSQSEADAEVEVESTAEAAWCKGTVLWNPPVVSIAGSGAATAPRASTSLDRAVLEFEPAAVAAAPGATLSALDTVFGPSGVNRANKITLNSVAPVAKTSNEVANDKSINSKNNKNNDNKNKITGKTDAGGNVVSVSVVLKSRPVLPMPGDHGALSAPLNASKCDPFTSDDEDVNSHHLATTNASTHTGSTAEKLAKIGYRIVDDKLSVEAAQRALCRIASDSDDDSDDDDDDDDDEDYDEDDDSDYDSDSRYKGSKRRDDETAALRITSACSLFNSCYSSAGKLSSKRALSINVNTTANIGFVDNPCTWASVNERNSDAHRRYVSAITGSTRGLTSESKKSPSVVSVMSWQLPPPLPAYVAPWARPVAALAVPRRFTPSAYRRGGSGWGVSAAKKVKPLGLDSNAKNSMLYFTNALPVNNYKINNKNNKKCTASASPAAAAAAAAAGVRAACIAVPQSSYPLVHRSTYPCPAPYISPFALTVARRGHWIARAFARRSTAAAASVLRGAGSGGDSAVGGARVRTRARRWSERRPWVRVPVAGPVGLGTEGVSPYWGETGAWVDRLGGLSRESKGVLPPVANTALSVIANGVLTTDESSSSAASTSTATTVVEDRDYCGGLILSEAAQAARRAHRSRAMLFSRWLHINGFHNKSNDNPHSKALSDSGDVDGDDSMDDDGEPVDHGKPPSWVQDESDGDDDGNNDEEEDEDEDEDENDGGGDHAHKVSYDDDESAERKCAGGEDAAYFPAPSSLAASVLYGNAAHNATNNSSNNNKNSNKSSLGGDRGSALKLSRAARVRHVAQSLRAEEELGDCGRAALWYRESLHWTGGLLWPNANTETSARTDIKNNSAHSKNNSCSSCGGCVNAGVIEVDTEMGVKVAHSNKQRQRRPIPNDDDDDDDDDEDDEFDDDDDDDSSGTYYDNDDDDDDDDDSEDDCGYDSDRGKRRGSKSSDDDDDDSMDGYDEYGFRLDLSADNEQDEDEDEDDGFISGYRGSGINSDSEDVRLALNSRSTAQIPRRLLTISTFIII